MQFLTLQMHYDKVSELLMLLLDGYLMLQYQSNLQASLITMWYFVGKCFPGWRDFDNKCYWYFGGVVKYAEAETLCRVCFPADRLLKSLF